MDLKKEDRRTIAIFKCMQKYDKVRAFTELDRGLYASRLAATALSPLRFMLNGAPHLDDLHGAHVHTLLGVTPQERGLLLHQLDLQVLIWGAEKEDPLVAAAAQTCEGE